MTMAEMLYWLNLYEFLLFHFIFLLNLDQICRIISFLIKSQLNAWIEIPILLTANKDLSLETPFEHVMLFKPIRSICNNFCK